MAVRAQLPKSSLQLCRIISTKMWQISGNQAESATGDLLYPRCLTYTCDSSEILETEIEKCGGMGELANEKLRESEKATLLGLVIGLPILI